MNEKLKKVLLNFSTDVIPLVIVSILGIFKLKLFVDILGNETLGLYQLFSQIMVYVALVDGGLSSAVLYSLYKPNATKDNQKLNELLAGALKIFSLIGLLVFTIAAAISFVVPFLIKDASFPYLYITFTFVLFSLSNVIGYFFVPYQALLEVKERKYISNLSLQIGQILLNILEIVMLVSGCSFILILFMHSVVKLIANVVICLFAKKIFPEIDFKHKPVDISFTKQVKHLVFHKISGLVSSNIDVLIISKILGLSYVAIYSSYNYIVNMLKTIFGKISSSILAIIGNAMVKSKEKIYDLFLNFNSFMFFLATIICVPLTYALNSFIAIWYEGKIDTSIYISIAFTLCFFVFLIKQPIATFVTADGLFKETKICAIVDASVNFILSIVLVYFIGIPGVLFATAFSSLIAEYIMKNVVLHKKLFDKKMTKFGLQNLKYFLITIADFILFYIIINKFTIASIGIWFLFYIVYFVINTSFIYIIYYLMGDLDFIKYLKGKTSNEKNNDITNKE